MIVFKIIVWVLGIVAILTGANDFWSGASVKGDFGLLGEAAKDPTLKLYNPFFGQYGWDLACY